MHPSFLRKANSAARVLIFQRKGWRKHLEPLLDIDKFVNFTNPYETHQVLMSGFYRRDI